MFRFVIAFLAAAMLSTSAEAKILVTVDKSTQQMTVEVDGVTRWQWPVSTGMRGYATPSGTFTAFRMEEDHYSKEFDDAPMPNSIFFTKRGHAIHGYLDTRRIGTAASHGCVRLEPENAKKLYALVASQGVTSATVVITGSEPSATTTVRARRPQYEEQARQPAYRQPQPYYGNPNAPPGYPSYGDRNRGYYDPYRGGYDPYRGGYYDRY